MARIDSQIRTSLTRQGPGAGNSGGQAIGRGLSALGQGLNDVGRAGTRVALGQMQRFNELHLHDAEMKYREFRSDLLYGEEGLTRRQGMDAQGIADLAEEKLREQLGVLNETAPNHVVRDAMKQRLELDIARTREFMGRHEQEKTEAYRVSQSAGLYDMRRQESVQNEPDRLLPGSPDFEEEVNERLRLRGSMFPGQAPEQVEAAAKAQMADDAAKAVFATLDQFGEGGVDKALQLRDAWGVDWDARQRAAVDKRIEDEFGFALIEDSVTGWAAENEGFTRKELVEGAADRYETAYRARMNEAPPERLMATVRRRAEEWDRLIDEDLREKKVALNNGLMMDFIRASRQGAGAEQAVSVAFQAIERQAYVTDDVELLNAALKLKNNWDTRHTFFARETTAEGWKMFLMPEGEALSTAELLAAQAVMTESDWKSWAPRHTAAAAAERLNSEADLKKTPMSELTAAINRDRANNGNSAYSRGDVELGQRLAALTKLEEGFVRTHDRKPTRSELDELTVASNYSLDDSGFDTGGAGETLGSFLTNPEAISAEQTRDRKILQLAKDIGSRDPAIAKMFQEDISFQDATLEELAEYPALVAALIEHGLVSNSPIFISELGPITARQQVDTFDQEN